MVWSTRIEPGSIATARRSGRAPPRGRRRRCRRTSRRCRHRRRLGRRRRGLVAVERHPCQRLRRRAVVDDHLVARLREVARHRGAHHAQTEKCDRAHGRRVWHGDVRHSIDDVGVDCPPCVAPGRCSRGTCTARTAPTSTALAAAIRAESPDVVVLQEIRKRAGGSARRRRCRCGTRGRSSTSPYTMLLPWRSEGMAIMTPHAARRGRSHRDLRRPADAQLAAPHRPVGAGRSAPTGRCCMIYNLHLSPARRRRGPAHAEAATGRRDRRAHR